jgi:hypothetical protein
MKENNNLRRKYVSRVDKLLKENASLNANIGIDSTKSEIDSIRKQIRANIRKIKDLCPYTYSIIEVDDNHKKTS